MDPYEAVPRGDVSGLPMLPWDWVRSCGSISAWSQSESYGRCRLGDKREIHVCEVHVVIAPPVGPIVAPDLSVERGQAVPLGQASVVIAPLDVLASERLLTG